MRLRSVVLVPTVTILDDGVPLWLNPSFIWSGASEKWAGGCGGSERGRTWTGQGPADIPVRWSTT
jgi:hypothetical protein